MVNINTQINSNKVTVNQSETPTKIENKTLKIVFNENQYEINNIRWEYDENNTPVDIVIYADEETLESISKFANIGWNIRKCDPVIDTINDAISSSHCGLFARLKEFIVIE